MQQNYVPSSPSINTAFSNSAAPSGWKFLGFTPELDLNLNPQAAFEGPFTVVDVPSVTYGLTYLTLDPIGAGEVVHEICDGSLVLSIGGVEQNNSYLVGGQLQFQDTGKGVISCTYTQIVTVLGQRVEYP